MKLVLRDYVDPEGVKRQRFEIDQSEIVDVTPKTPASLPEPTQTGFTFNVLDGQVITS